METDASRFVTTSPFMLMKVLGTFVTQLSFRQTDFLTDSRNP
jgi:hypothetical protein